MIGRIVRELTRDIVSDIINERLDALLAGDEDCDFRIEVHGQPVVIARPAFTAIVEAIRANLTREA